MEPETNQFHVLKKDDFNERIPGEPPSTSQQALFVGADFSGITNESDLCALLKSVIQSVLEAANATYVRVGADIDTEHHEETNRNGSIKSNVSDTSIYLNILLSRSAGPSAAKRSLRRATVRNRQDDLSSGLRSSYHQAVHIEAKIDPDASTLHFPAEPCTPNKNIELITDSIESSTLATSLFQDSSKAKSFALGSSKSMLDIFNDQHRLFSYAIYVVKSQARLLYYDRSGVFVSEVFDWTLTSSFFHTFVWKLAHMSPEDLGYDPTTSLASPTETGRFLGMIKDYTLPRELRDMVSHATKHRFPICKVRVAPAPPSQEDRYVDTELEGAPSGGKAKFFLIGRPSYSADTLFGECTRRYIALDLQTGKLCSLKDYWRPLVPGWTRPEHAVYQHFRYSDVTSGIATLVCGGDVGGFQAQRTVVQDFQPVQDRPVSRVHYRIVTAEVGLPLASFSSFKELCRVLTHAMEGHYLAWTKGEVLHRNVSTSSILIDPFTRNGFLVDWDLSRFKSELSEGSFGLDGSGAWPFNSALLLKYPRKPHRLADDIESFVHIFYYLVLRYHKTNVPDLRVKINRLYEHSSRLRGIKIGGDDKLINNLSPQPSFSVTTDDYVLQSILRQLATVCHNHYILIDLSRMEELYGLYHVARTPHAPGRLHTPVNSPGRGFEVCIPIPSSAALMSARMTMGAVPTPSNVPQDPCDVDGPLSSHGHVVGALSTYQTFTESPNHRPQDQFSFDTGPLEEDVPQDPSGSQLGDASSAPQPSGIPDDESVLELTDSETTVSVSKPQSKPGSPTARPKAPSKARPAAKSASAAGKGKSRPRAKTGGGKGSKNKKRQRAEETEEAATAAATDNRGEGPSRNVQRSSKRSRRRS